MIDRTHSGYRCSVIHPLRTVQGDLPRGSHGTVVYETDNLDRHLILVTWDNGIVVPVFPGEINFEGESTGTIH
ncbi:MAG: hypothetical protein AB7G75_13145 [Candidatus Binatia bacterium]